MRIIRIAQAKPAVPAQPAAGIRTKNGPQANPQTGTQPNAQPKQQNTDTMQTNIGTQPSPQELQGALRTMFNAVTNWLIKDSAAVIEYMANPTEQARFALAKRAISGAVNSGLERIPFAGFILTKLNIGNAVGGAVGNTKAAQTLMAWVVDFISKNLNMGMIPDEISRQNKALERFDFDDNISAQQEFQTAMKEIRAKYASQPQLISQFITILLRLKDNQNLLNIELGLMQKANSKGRQFFGSTYAFKSI